MSLAFLTRATIILQAKSPEMNAARKPAIIGSNMFNILLILGGSALINPLSLNNISLVDLGMLLMSALLIWSSIYVGKRNQIDRADGAILVILDIAYMAWLIIKG